MIDGKSAPSLGKHFFNVLMDKAMVFANFTYKKEGGGEMKNQKFFAKAEHSSKFPEVPRELKPYLKVIDVDRAYGDKFDQYDTGKPWVVNVGQDNTGTLSCADGEKSVSPASIYIARKGEEAPEFVELNFGKSLRPKD